MQGPTQGRSVGESSTPRVRGGAGNEQFARTAQEIGRLERAEPSDPEKAYGIERLKKLGATMFEGSIDPTDAKNWLNMLEKCFDVMNCTEERKVRLATFLLQKEAEGWWKSILAMHSDTRPLDWQTFRGIFEDKYYPNTCCEAKRDEFLGLKQGSLSVAEYKRKYTELSWYANVIVASEMETALRVEQSITEEKSAVEPSRGTSTASALRNREQRRFTPGINISTHQDFKNRSGGQASRNCEQPGHFKKDYPQLNMTVQRDQRVGSQTVEQSRVSVVPTEGTSSVSQKGVIGRPRQQGKVYAMTQQEAEDAPDVITAEMDVRAFTEELAIYTPVGDVLLVNEVLRNCEVLVEGSGSEELAIYTPVGDVLLVNEVLRNYEVLVEGINMLVDLILLELQRLDVILGMDFLFAYYTSMDCHRKEVVFRKPSLAEVVFRGMRKVISRSLISVLKAEKLLRKGCIAFLAQVIVVQREKLKPEDVPVVKEFLMYFPMIYKATYRMAQSELKEFKMQLQELVDKGYIRLSVSPWGTPVLFVKKKDGYHQLKVRESDIAKTAFRTRSTRTDQPEPIDTHPSRHSSRLQAVGPPPVAARTRKPVRHASFTRKTRPNRVSAPLPNETLAGPRLFRLQAVAEHRVPSLPSSELETRPAYPAPRELDRSTSPFVTRAAPHLSIP
ncbi:reverse transcriptase [Cucumis melo var. makuwa]|nr:reverse transcriptase [Cucumis melo var. makuwa]